MREKEVVQLAEQIAEKKEEYQVLSDKVENYDKGIEKLNTLEQILDASPEYQLSEPLVQKLKTLVKAAIVKCFEAWDSYYRLNITNGNLHRENERLTKINELADVAKQAEDIFFRLVKEYADRQGVTEQLKAENQLEWVGKMCGLKAPQL